MDGRCSCSSAPRRRAPPALTCPSSDTSPRTNCATTNEIPNGFLNRFIHLAARRVRLLPEGGDPDPLKHTGLQRFLAAAIQHARHAGQLRLNEHARKLW
jgi:hypothetical protein